MERSLHNISKYERFSIWLKSYGYCISYSSFWSTVLCNVHLGIYSFLFVTKNNFWWFKDGRCSNCHPHHKYLIWIMSKWINLVNLIWIMSKWINLVNFIVISIALHLLYKIKSTFRLHWQMLGQYIIKKSLKIPKG